MKQAKEIQGTYWLMCAECCNSHSLTRILINQIGNFLKPDTAHNQLKRN